MTIDNHIKNGKLHYDVNMISNRQAKSTSMNILLMKKYYLLIKSK